MMTEREDLIQKAEDSVTEVFNDRSVSRSETAIDLTNLQDFIQIMLDTLN